MTRYLRGVKVKDVVLNVAFEKDGQSYLYATVNALGTTFAPDAPSL